VLSPAERDRLADAIGRAEQLEDASVLVRLAIPG